LAGFCPLFLITKGDKMCLPQGSAQLLTSAILTTASTVAKGVIQNAEQKQSDKYRAQVAAVNINNAKNEALKEQQLGIEEAREKKIEGIRKANALLAQNSANGFDSSSATSNLNYLDVLDSYNSDAQNALNKRYENADNYLAKAKNYLNQYYYSSKSVSPYAGAINSLNSAKKVADSWYKFKEGVNSNAFIQSKII